MFERTRHRRGPYALADGSMVPGVLRTAAVLLVTGIALFFIGRGILRFFGAGENIDRTSVLLMAEPRGAVNVSLEGGAVQRAQDSLKLYVGDKVSTARNGYARLLFFDASRARLNEQTDIVIADTARGTVSSSYAIELTRGSIHLLTPTTAAFSGSIVRTIQTPVLTLTVPPGTELIAGASSLAVIEAAGLGVEVAVQGSKQTIVIGEGQACTLSENADRTGDLYVYRTMIDADLLTEGFVTSSRTVVGAAAGETGIAAVPQDEILTVSTPEQGQLVQEGTVAVAGKVGKGVASIRVNGYKAAITSDGSFRQELALQEEEETDIRVEALDAQGIILQEIRRIVRRSVKLPDAPSIVFPAKTGETYRTHAAEFEIRGAASVNAAGIIVNDYRLQLYKPGSRAWSYLASTKLGNMVPGRNVYTIVAIDATGNRSAPVTITILFEEGPEGVVAGAPVTGTTGSSASSINPADLPQNAPLKPGSLAVTGPTAGAQHTATGSEILIEGTTDASTASMWVNDYKLQLYKSGKTTWNYIAKTSFFNLKPGKNTYRIVARNDRDEIIDALEYVVDYPR